MREKPILEIQKRVTREFVSAGIYRLLFNVFGPKEPLDIPCNYGLTKFRLNKWCAGKSNFTLNELTEISYRFGKKPVITFVDL